MALGERQICRSYVVLPPNLGAGGLRPVLVRKLQNACIIETPQGVTCGSSVSNAVNRSVP